MIVTRQQVISFLITTAIFGCGLGYFIDWTHLKGAMGAGEEINIATISTETTAKFTYAQPIDNLNGVNVFYNGNTGTVTGRNVTADGYNLGLKYQCVEFIKRYYYEYYEHKMPDTYGHAKDFYDSGIKDGLMNRTRDLRQYTNGSIARPRTGDILIFGATPSNKYGHIGIVAKSSPIKIEMIHQNSGSRGETRTTYQITKSNDKWYVESKYALGWLRRS